jgi:nitrile hydratase
VDSDADGFVAFDSAKVLIYRAVAAVCRAKVGRCVYDLVRNQTNRPLSASAPIPRCRYSVDFTRIHRRFARTHCLRREGLMDTTRRGFLASTAAASGAAMTQNLAQAADEHAHDHQALPSEPALRVKSLESLLVEKGLVDPAALDAVVDIYEHKVGPRNGARVVARAWVDPAYKARLLSDGRAALRELGYGGAQGEDTLVVENTPRVHNLVVCTLCSCYPWPLLGLPPVWYKSAPYRSRAVIDPRGVLREFGVMLADDVEVHVWDSTAELRYLVLPERPVGSEHLSEDALAALVTRDAMVGIAKVALPQKGAQL